MSGDHLLEQLNAARRADELTGANSELFDSPFARTRLDKKYAPQSPSDRELAHRLRYLYSNDPDRAEQRLKTGGYTTDDLRELWWQNRSGVELADAESTYALYLERITSNARPAHCVQVFDRAYLRDQYGEPLAYDDPVAHATGVITWPVPLYWSALRVVLALLHSDSVECWWCSVPKGRMFDVEGYRLFVPVHFGSITRVYPTCPSCRQRLDKSVEGGVTVVTLEDALNLRNYGYAADHRRNIR